MLEKQAGFPCHDGFGDAALAIGDYRTPTRLGLYRHQPEVFNARKNQGLRLAVEPRNLLAGSPAYEIAAVVGVAKY